MFRQRPEQVSQLDAPIPVWNEGCLEDHLETLTNEQLSWIFRQGLIVTRLLEVESGDSRDDKALTFMEQTLAKMVQSTEIMKQGDLSQYLKF